MLRRTIAVVAALWLFCLVVLELPSAEMMLEEDRRAEYAARGYRWPIPDEWIQPNTPGWIQLMRRRLRQVESIGMENRVEKYDAWKLAMCQAFIVPNHTQYGWGVTRAPTDLVEDIQEALRHGIPHAVKEGFDPCIVGGEESVMVDIGDLTDKALHRMKPYLEAWTGIPLQPIKGYGLRLYHNNSRLYMHVDKVETHVISAIIHIDRSIDYQTDSFPLVIEDLEGNTQHVYLSLGDAFLYESAKCLHGRPFPLHGSWFTSLFLHYAPLDWPMERKNLDAAFAIPDHWQEVLPYEAETLSRLHMVDTGMYEPDCPDQWCGTGRPVVWEGPAKDGVVTSSNGAEQTLSIPGHSARRDEL